MSCKIINQTGMDQDALSGVITDFYPYAQEKLGFQGPVSVKLISDKENASDMFGKTAFYDPMEKMVSLFVDGRHPKDILRSFSHELVHHLQNERGEFDNLDEIGEGYAQNNLHLREMEAEAYLEGNMNFRDYEDKTKTERKKTMKLDESTLKEMVLETLKELLEQDTDMNDGGTTSINDKMPDINDVAGKKDLDALEETDESGFEAKHQPAPLDPKIFDPETGLARTSNPMDAFKNISKKYKFPPVKKQMRPVKSPLYQVDKDRAKARKSPLYAPNYTKEQLATLRKMGAPQVNPEVNIRPYGDPSPPLQAPRMEESASADVMARTKPEGEANKGDFLPPEVRKKINAKDEVNNLDEREVTSLRNMGKKSRFSRDLKVDPIDPKLKKDMVSAVPDVKLKPTTPIGRAAKRDINLDKRGAFGQKQRDALEKMLRTVKGEDALPKKQKKMVAPTEKAPHGVKKESNEAAIPSQESVSDEQWYKSTLYETLKKKWTK